MDYITAKEAAGKWEISARRVQLLCEQGRVEGVVRLGWAWAIPREAEKPKDARFAQGRISGTNDSGEFIDDKIKVSLLEIGGNVNA